MAVNGDPTQGVEGGDVLPRVLWLLWVGLQHDGVHVIADTEARHLRRVHSHSEQVLAAAQTHLRGDRR